MTALPALNLRAPTSFSWSALFGDGNPNADKIARLEERVALLKADILRLRYGGPQKQAELYQREMELQKAQDTLDDARSGKFVDTRACLGAETSANGASTADPRDARAKRSSGRALPEV